MKKSTSEHNQHLNSIRKRKLRVAAYPTKKSTEKEKKIKGRLVLKKVISFEKPAGAVVERVSKNPIMEPMPLNQWESNAVFNPGAINIDNKVHFIYRAIGESGLSVFGYASSTDGICIEERLAEPAFVCENPRGNLKKNITYFPYLSGGSWWGCEDPRLTRIDETLYMTYTAFDGCSPPGVAITSIGIDDFLNKRWSWKDPVLLSSPNEINKNWVIFPEKINGQFAILHSITPKILIDYFPVLDFDKMPLIKSYYHSHGREAHWDNWVRGIGPPPMKIKDGWLVLYHAMDKRDPDKYKIGAMILDPKKPERILYRSTSPLLEPCMWYENNGHKKGVVYTCGATIVNEKLFVYYGGSDTFICAATIDLKTLLIQLKRSQHPTMKIVSSIDSPAKRRSINSKGKVEKLQLISYLAR